MKQETLKIDPKERDLLGTLRVLEILGKQPLSGSVAKATYAPPSYTCHPKSRRMSLIKSSPQNMICVHI